MLSDNDFLLEKMGLQIDSDDVIEQISEEFLENYNQQPSELLHTCRLTIELLREYRKETKNFREQNEQCCHKLSALMKLHKPNIPTPENTRHLINDYDIKKDLYPELIEEINKIFCQYQHLKHKYERQKELLSGTNANDNDSYVDYPELIDEESLQFRNKKSLQKYINELHKQVNYLEQEIHDKNNIIKNKNKEIERLTDAKLTIENRFLDSIRNSDHLKVEYDVQVAKLRSRLKHKEKVIKKLHKKHSSQKYQNI